MTLPAVLGLIALALADSTSIGTFLIPLWLLLRPGWRVRLILIYLATITGFYLLVGLLLMGGLLTLLPILEAALAHPAADWAELALGVALFALSFFIDPKAAAKRAARSGRAMSTTPRWQARLDGAAATPAGMATLALGAGLVEVATMLPYLAAIAIVSSFGLSAAGSGFTLAGYTLIMVLPALGLMAARLLAGRRINEALDRLGAWLARHTAGSVSWIAAILGVLLTWDAVDRLGLLSTLGWGA
jgi:Sap, sulfolipid-1-addressing protein